MYESEAKCLAFFIFASVSKSEKGSPCESGTVPAAVIFCPC
jgi:hypothetical protein